MEGRERFSYGRWRSAPARPWKRITCKRGRGSDPNAVIKIRFIPMLFANGGLMALGTMKTKRAPCGHRDESAGFFPDPFRNLVLTQRLNVRYIPSHNRRGTACVNKPSSEQVGSILSFLPCSTS